MRVATFKSKVAIDSKGGGLMAKRMVIVGAGIAGLSSIVADPGISCWREQLGDDDT